VGCCKHFIGGGRADALNLPPTATASALPLPTHCARSPRLPALGRAGTEACAWPVCSLWALIQRGRTTRTLPSWNIWRSTVKTPAQSSSVYLSILWDILRRKRKTAGTFSAWYYPARRLLLPGQARTGLYGKTLPPRHPITLNLPMRADNLAIAILCWFRARLQLTFCAHAPQHARLLRGSARSTLPASCLLRRSACRAVPRFTLTDQPLAFCACP